MLKLLGGTCQYAKLKPDIPAGLFSKDLFDGNRISDKFAMNTSRRRSNDASKSTRPSNRGDIFEDDDYADDDFLAAGRKAISTTRCLLTIYLAEEIDLNERPSNLSFSKSLNPILNSSSRMRRNDPFSDNEQQQPEVLVNGKYKCNHKCKDKSAFVFLLFILGHANLLCRCKHFCCREGLDKPPKVYKKVASAEMTPIKQGKTNQLSLVDTVLKKVDRQSEQHKTNLSKHMTGTKSLTFEAAPSKAMRMANLDLAVSQPAARKLTFEAGESGNRKRKRKRSQNRREPSSEFGDSDLEQFFMPSVFLPQSDNQASPERYDPAVEDAGIDGTIEGIETDFGLPEHEFGDTKTSPLCWTSDDVLGFPIDSDERQRISQTQDIQSPQLPALTNGNTQQSFYPSNDAMEREDAVKRCKVSEVAGEENIDQSLLEEFRDIVNFTGI